MISGPEFFVVGAAKAGTTTLYYLLKKHPQIKMSALKETNFFSLGEKNFSFAGPGDMDGIGSFSVVNREDYIRLFIKNDKEIISGEVSPLYLYDPGVPVKIKAEVPDAKIVIILRNPVDRCYSAWMYAKLSLREKEDFWNGIRLEKARLKAGWEFFWAYVGASRYYEQVKRYYEIFGSQKIFVILLEEFSQNPKKYMADMYEFLGVDPTFCPNISRKYNIGGQPRISILHRILRFSFISKFYRDSLPDEVKYYLRVIYSKINLQRADSLRDRDRKRLMVYFHHDIEMLEDLLQRDLSIWKWNVSTTKP